MILSITGDKGSDMAGLHPGPANRSDTKYKLNELASVTSPIQPGCRCQTRCIPQMGVIFGDESAHSRHGCGGPKKWQTLFAQMSKQLSESSENVGAWMLP
jgi:hypothetical protein